jgi:hypothetical protein
LILSATRTPICFQGSAGTPVRFVTPPGPHGDGTLAGGYRNGRRPPKQGCVGELTHPCVSLIPAFSVRKPVPTFRK